MSVGVRGLTQRQFGELVGFTRHRAHSYETGVDGVAAGRRYEIARALSTPLEYFFEGFEQDERKPLPHQGLLLDDIA